MNLKFVCSISDHLAKYRGLFVNFAHSNKNLDRERPLPRNNRISCFRRIEYSFTVFRECAWDYSCKILLMSLMYGLCERSRYSLFLRAVMAYAYTRFFLSRLKVHFDRLDNSKELVLLLEVFESRLWSLKSSSVLAWQSGSFSPASPLSSVDCFYFQSFCTKVGKNVLSHSSFLTVEKSITKSNWNVLLNSGSVFYLNSFLEDKIGFVTSIEALIIPLDSRSIFRWEDLSQLSLDREGSWWNVPDYYSSVGVRDRFVLGNSVDILSNLLVSEDLVDLSESKNRDNYNVIMHKYLPFLGQYRDWEPKSDQHLNNNIAEESEEEPSEVLFVLNVGKGLVRVSAKSVLERYVQVFSIMYFYYGYFLSNIAVFQEGFIHSKSYYAMIRLFNGWDLVQYYVYCNVVKPLHNLSKIIFGLAILFLIYPYKPLDLSQSSVDYIVYAVPFFLSIQGFTWFYRFLWYFFTGIKRKPTRLDIDTNVLVFAPLLIAFPCFLYADFIIDPDNGFFAIFKLWYLNHKN